MFLTLLLVTFAVAIAVALLVSRMFTQPIDMILKRIIADAISAAWLKYMKFAILVVGISSGVRIYELEKYIVPARFDKENKLLERYVHLSGLTKQDYITSRMLERPITVNGNPRVYKALRDELAEVLEQLRKIEAGNQVDADLLAVISMIATVMDGMKGSDTI